MPAYGSDYEVVDTNTGKIYPVNIVQLTKSGLYRPYAYLIGELVDRSIWTKKNLDQWFTDNTDKHVDLWSFPSGFISKPKHILDQYNLILRRKMKDNQS